MTDQKIESNNMIKELEAKKLFEKWRSSYVRFVSHGKIARYPTWEKLSKYSKNHWIRKLNND